VDVPVVLVPDEPHAASAKAEHSNKIRIRVMPITRGPVAPWLAVSEPMIKPMRNSLPI